ncbi:MAG: 3-dehydroquinate synthase II family protein [Desulfovibrionaceae bacterium]|nr:3-dehydroquinate synthase II family protein [Desulfovibrionaceae bacterium]
MPSAFFLADPYILEDVTAALEAGADNFIVPPEHLSQAGNLARCRFIASSSFTFISLASKEDENRAEALLRSGVSVILRHGWEVIPVENLLAHSQGSPQGGELLLEVISPEETQLAFGILEKGVHGVAVPSSALGKLKEILSALRSEQTLIPLSEARILEISPTGMGHRVCVDTLSNLNKGQGLLVGNSAAFTFLVNAETERNEYVSPRPFRVNAGAVHAYTFLPGDCTAYLEELRAGSKVLIVDFQGRAETAVAGRIKVEKRPMLLIRAEAEGREGVVFLQNAETIRLVTPEGEARSVVALSPGDRVLCRLDQAGRHFGVRITENIDEK